MKQIYLFLLTGFLCLGVHAQTINIVGNPGTSGNIVIGQSNYHVSESIYTEAEIGAGNFTTAGTSIDEVYFIVTELGIVPTVNNFRVYMRNVPLANTVLTTGIYSTAGYTQVFNGTLNASATGLVGVTLSTPFVRTAGTNLQVLIERVDNTLHTGYILQAAVGNSADVNTLSSRRYNAAGAPVSGVTSLTNTNFRPAIILVNSYPNDAAVSDLITPGITCFNTPQTISVEISNVGTNPIAAGAASTTLRVRGANTFTATLTNPAIIAPGASALINFTGINLNNAGLNEDTAYVTLAGDGTTTNDTLTTESITATTLNTFPLVEDAETTLPFVSYAQTIAFDQLWTLQTGNYTNADMPSPLVPRAPGTRFFLFDSYSGANSTGFESRLFSNCIAIPSNSTALMTFYMSHDNVFPTSLDSIYVSVSTNRGVSWTRLAGFQRADLAAAVPVWRIENVSLSAYAGQTIQVGFEGTSQYGNAIGLDDINITVSSLPITLLSFEALRAGAVNNLRWSTSQEANSNRFIVERSNNGRDFEEIGTVAAAGNSTDTRNYRFTDPAPLKGINYYRLRMVDNDNTYKYSTIRNVRNLDVADISFAPNPVQDFIRLSIEAEKPERAFVRITDMSGKLVHQSQLNVVAGANQNQINTSTLSAGTYILTVQMGDGNLVRKFTKE